MQSAVKGTYGLTEVLSLRSTLERLSQRGYLTKSFDTFYSGIRSSGKWSVTIRSNWVLIDIDTLSRKEFTRYFALFSALASVRWSVAARIESRLLCKSR